MSSLLTDIMTASEGRYLTTQEAETLRDYVRGFEARLAAASEVEDKEQTVCERATRAIMSGYPDYEQNHPGAYEKSVRDMALVLRYCTQALVVGSKDRLDQSLLIWFSTILRGLGFTQAFIQDTYGALEEALQAELSTTTFQAIAPYVAHARSVLASKAAVN